MSDVSFVSGQHQRFFFGDWRPNNAIGRVDHVRSSWENIAAKPDWKCIHTFVRESSPGVEIWRENKLKEFEEYFNEIQG